MEFNLNHYVEWLKIIIIYSICILFTLVIHQVVEYRCGKGGCQTKDMSQSLAEI